MQITIEDLSPVEKRVEFELPWSDVVPKLEKAYDSLRRGVRLPGFRPGKVPRALIEKMYKRQVEDEVARDLVDHSIGQAIRENQIHHLENVLQTGRKDGMVLMDNCLYDLYCKCLISYDTAVSRARHPDRITRQKT